MATTYIVQLRGTGYRWANKGKTTDWQVRASSARKARRLAVQQIHQASPDPWRPVSVRRVR